MITTYYFLKYKTIQKSRLNYINSQSLRHWEAKDKVEWQWHNAGFRWEKLVIGFPGEVDVPEEADDGHHQRAQQKGSEIEVDDLSRRPNLRRENKTDFNERNEQFLYSVE